MSLSDDYFICQVSHKTADLFLKNNHYLAQQGNGFMSKYNYGLFTNDGLQKILGIVTFSGISVVETLIGAFSGGVEKHSNVTALRKAFLNCQDYQWLMMTAK